MCEQPGDDELMTRGAEGDDAAFGLLVGRWEKRVFAFLERMLGSREEAQDVAQEAFLLMCLHAKDYRATGQFRSWLFRIAGNLANLASINETSSACDPTRFHWARGWSVMKTSVS